MKVAHQNAYYDIEIDGRPDTTIFVATEGQFIFRKTLAPQDHTLRIRLRNENHYTAGTFFGLVLADGKELSAAPEKPQRKIEFIGDSFTAGYGIESTSRTCSGTLDKFTNVNLTFAALLTRSFKAQSTILAWSGAGLVRNYGAAGKRSADAYPTHYDQTLGAVWDSPKWNYSTWKPDLVVICLGTNDYSTTPNPDDSMYIGDYHKFIARILGNYPEASILCVSTGNATFEKNCRKIVSDEVTKYSHPKVYFAPYPASLENTGCDWHPSIADNRNVAKILTDTIMEKLKWDTTGLTGDVHEAAHPTAVRQAASFTAALFSGELRISAAHPVAPGTRFLLLNMRGETVADATISHNRACSFATDRLGTGIFLAGNSKLGWLRIAVRR
jgi:lysophospholipase L1-like esterase